MNILSIENVSKNFGIDPLFEGTTFGLDESDRVGVIGRNGSGKTTLLRIIAGDEEPDSGRVALANGKHVVYIPQNPKSDADATVLDALFPPTTPQMRLLREYEDACLRLATTTEANPGLLERVSELSHQLEADNVWSLEATARAALTRLGITDMTARMGTLSGGERRRVALAHALIARPDLLILDEPTNHLDADTVEWLEGELSRYSGALVVVTHDRYFLDRVTNRILEIDAGAVRSFAGNYAYYLEKKAEMEIARAGAEAKRESTIRRELAWLRRGAKARSTKQKARVDRAHELMATPEERTQGALSIAAGTKRLGKKILAFEGVSKAYGARSIISGFSYTLKRGDRLGVVGPNGAGKSTLLEMIAGRLAPDAGVIDRGETVELGYFDQESRALADEQRVIDYVKEAGDRIETADGEAITATQMLDRFLFPPEAQYAPIGKLSGGERRRLYLLRVLMRAPNVLLLDEPTNDFDIQTLVTLEEYLDGYPGCLVVVSHDRYFLDRTADHIFFVPGDGSVRQYAGNYSAFLSARAAEAVVEAKPKARPAEKVVQRDERTDVARKLSFKERREFDELEASIAEAERRQTEIEGELTRVGADFGVADALFKEQQALAAQLDRDIARWGELAERA